MLLDDTVRDKCTCLKKKKTSGPSERCMQFLANEVLLVTKPDQTIYGLDAQRPAASVVGHVDDLIHFVQRLKDERPS